MKSLRCEVNGLTALLMHNPVGQMGGSPEGKRPKVPSPEDEAKRSRYLLKGDELGIPTIALRNCILSGSKGFKVGKYSLYAMLGGCLSILPEDGFVPLLRGGKSIKDYTVDIRRAVVQKQGILRARTKVELPWQVVFDVLWEDAILPPSFPNTLQEIIEKAGTTVGLLDYRPERKGWFGKFELVSLTAKD